MDLSAADRAEVGRRLAAAQRQALEVGRADVRFPHVADMPRVPFTA